MPALAACRSVLAASKRPVARPSYCIVFPLAASQPSAFSSSDNSAGSEAWMDWSIPKQWSLKETTRAPPSEDPERSKGSLYRRSAKRQLKSGSVDSLAAFPPHDSIQEQFAGYFLGCQLEKSS